MKKTLFVVVALLMTCAFVGQAQGRKSVRINEVLVENLTSITDEYGQHAGWIEIFNSNFAPVDIASMFITNDPNNPTKYPVPRGSEETKMGKRQHVVFYADGQPNHGPRHTNFVLVPGQDNWIGLYDADGLTLIDSITIPAAVLIDQSYARKADGDDEWVIRTGNDDLDADYVTPASANIIVEGNDRIKAFSENDKDGFGMTVMAMCIVFGALLILSICFNIIGSIGKRSARIKKAQATGVEVSAVGHGDHDSGEEIAAIAMALHEHFDQHDNESLILTVKKMKRAYSPWSSKIYGLRELPNRK